MNKEAAYKPPEIIEAIDVLCGWAIENDVSLQIKFIQDFTYGSIGRDDTFTDMDIPYMIAVTILYKDVSAKMILDPCVMDLYKDNVDVIKEVFDRKVELVKSYNTKRRKRK